MVSGDKIRVVRNTGIVCPRQKAMVEFGAYEVIKCSSKLCGNNYEVTKVMVHLSKGAWNENFGIKIIMDSVLLPGYTS